MSFAKTLRCLSTFAFLAFVVLPMGACCCDDCCEDGNCPECAVNEVETVAPADETAETRRVIGWRFFCHDAEHRPAGPWRGSFCKHEEAAQSEASTHCRRWGCDLADTFVRPEY